LIIKKYINFHKILKGQNGGVLVAEKNKDFVGAVALAKCSLLRLGVNRMSVAALDKVFSEGYLLCLGL
jgi:NAD(P)H-hydrate repair Nnr-like enzyme with NAD(P)H-hydrate dehydratase domain